LALPHPGDLETYWVEHKLAEADFFLERLAGVVWEKPRPFVEAQFYMSAFVSACRNVTYALQAAARPIPEFVDWYKTRQQRLVSDPMAKFFADIRDETVHVGVNSLAGVLTVRNPEGHVVSARCFFRDTTGGSHHNTPGRRREAVAACRAYLRTLVRLVWEFCRHFAPYLDPAQCLSQQNLDGLGWCVEDVEEFSGYGKGYTARAGRLDMERLAILRRLVAPTFLWSLSKKYIRRSRPRTWSRAS